MKRYIPRIADEILDFKLKTKGAVWIKGPKWCGKSTTAKRFSKTCILMQDENTREQNIQLAKTSPSFFLKGDTPLLIDEWQTIPFIWNQIRTEVDKRDEFGQFILTGSVTPNDERLKDQHSGTGRITDMVMRPMSLFESEESSGAISIKALFNGDKVEPARCNSSLEDYAFYTARGGWPKSIELDGKIALQQAIDYYEGLVESDISHDSRKDPERVRLLMRSYARNCSTQANNSTIKNDMIANDSEKLDEDTIRTYINSLKSLYVVEESEAWNPNVRSKTAIRTSNTRYFVDPSIACAALNLGPEGLIRDLKTFGLLFENMCIRDLRIYSEPLGGKIRHFRNNKGLESDAVITLKDGSWAAVEIKLGNPDLIEEAAKNLIELKNDVNKEPRFLMIMTATDVAYQREDDIWIVPAGCLGP